MTNIEAMANIRTAIDNAPRNCYIAELHLQVIKYAQLLQNVSGKEFCEHVKLSPAFGTEFAKMKKISSRLVSAGLNVEKI